MSSLITIPLSRLPHDIQQRRKQLREYFCDKDAVATQVDDTWLLTLEWSNEPERYVDPLIAEGLAWWGGELQYSDMAVARKRKGRVMLSLNDTWTLESWSEWLAGDSGRSEIVVLHVDDHKDLGSPRIFLTSGGWIDPINGQVVDLRDPNSVASSIESGAFGMGSFLTPFLHVVQNADVRHLCQAPKCVDTQDFDIKLELVADSLLNLDACRPSIALEQTKNRTSRAKSDSRGRYRFTDNMEAWLEDLDGQLTGQDTVFLLHIDMDYFCNRYDGDSDAVNFPFPLNPSLPEIFEQIDKLIEALKRHSLLVCLHDIVIAFSPGFFPAEFWAPCCERLLKGLEQS